MFARACRCTCIQPGTSSRLRFANGNDMLAGMNCAQKLNAADLSRSAALFLALRTAWGVRSCTRSTAQHVGGVGPSVWSSWARDAWAAWLDVMGRPSKLSARLRTCKRRGALFLGSVPSFRLLGPAPKASLLLSVCEPLSLSLRAAAVERHHCCPQPTMRFVAHPGPAMQCRVPALAALHHDVNGN